MAVEYGQHESLSLTDSAWSGNYFKTTVRSSILHDLNPYQIMFYLGYIAVGDLVGPQEMVGFAQGMSVGKGKEGEISRQQQEVWLREFVQVKDYWRKRFGEIGRALRMFGLNSIKAIDITRILEQFTDEFAPDGKLAKNILDLSLWSGEIPDFGIARDLVSKFMPYYQVNKSNPPASKSEMMSKADIARNVANAIGYEFFMDTTGEIIFKPPFWNMNTKDNVPFSIIKDEDIFSLNEAEEAPVATRMDVHGSMHNMSQNERGIVYGYDLNWNLIKKYGYKPAEKQVNYLRTA